MSFDPWERVRPGGTQVEVTRPDLGSARMGGLSATVPWRQADALPGRIDVAAPVPGGPGGPTP